MALSATLRYLLLPTLLSLSLAMAFHLFHLPPPAWGLNEHVQCVAVAIGPDRYPVPSSKRVRIVLAEA